MHNILYVTIIGKRRKNNILGYQPTDRCLDVPNREYTRGAINAVYSPKTGGTLAKRAYARPMNIMK